MDFVLDLTTFSNFTGREASFCPFYASKSTKNNASPLSMPRLCAYITPFILFFSVLDIKKIRLLFALLSCRFAVANEHYNDYRKSKQCRKALFRSQIFDLATNFRIELRHAKVQLYPFKIAFPALKKTAA